MRRWRLHTITTAALVVGALGSAQLANADPKTEEVLATAYEAAHRVNLAGRQRMLSQAIVKSACFAALEIDTESQFSKLRERASQFGITLDALRFGNSDPEFGFGPEGYSGLLDLLSVVSSDWETYSNLIETALATGSVSRPALERIDEVSLVLLGDMNRAVNKIANTYGEALSDIPLLLSLTIDLAGRQRMFTQKAAKELCLIEAGVDVAENRENLAKTIQFFSLTQAALIDGMPGIIMAAPNDDIRQKLIDVRLMWSESIATFENVVAGSVPDDAELLAISRNMNRLMAMANEAVVMYEDVIREHVDD